MYNQFRIFCSEDLLKASYTRSLAVKIIDGGLASLLRFQLLALSGRGRVEVQRKILITGARVTQVNFF